MITIFTLVLITGISGVIFMVTTNNMRAARHHAERAAAMSYADGILENLFDQWRHQMITTPDPTDRREGPTTSQLTANLSDPSATLPPPDGLTLVDWGIRAADPFLAPMPNDDDRPKPEAGSASKLRVRLNYLGRATVQYNSRAGVDAVTVERSFVRGGRNLFDDFLFSTQRITEIHPGAPMYIDRCQINGDAYLAHDFLHLMSSFNYTGSLTLNYRTDDPRFGDAPTIVNGGTDDNWDPNRPPRQGPEQKLLDTRTEDLESVFLDDPTNNDISNDKPTNNPNNDGFHELIEESVPGYPDPLQVDANTSERLPSNADYRIYVDKDNKIIIYEGGNTNPITSGPAYAAIISSLTPNQAFRDTREKDNVRLVTMDVGKVKAGVDSGAIQDRLNQDGLLIHIVDTSSGTSVPTRIVNSSTGASTNVTSTRQRGIRLINGATLPTINLGGGAIGGFTVTSPNAVYIQGDYNTGSTSSSKPPSNTTSSYTPPNDTPNPVVTGYERVPAAVVGDAVNVLSNTWNDANSTSGKNSRVASNTTVNTAIIAGNVPTKNSSYSGGIENFVRFHETWSGKYFTIYGALALLYASNQAKGAWVDADYNPPNRRWFYDTLFHDHNPPGIQAARAYDRGRWTTR
jgi:hypothetical protein